MMTELSKRRFVVLALFITSLLGSTVHAAGQTVLSSLPQAAMQNEAAGKKGIATDLFLRTELFFGSDREDAPDVTEDQFRHFLDKIVTPEFPDGLTLLTGKGQFCCDSGGAIIQETSFVLILLYPLETLKESSEKIEKIRRDYKAAFKQQSVLRVDDPRPVRVSF
jgi:Protein of unknown function (DUF3574)